MWLRLEGHNAIAVRRCEHRVEAGIGANVQHDATAVAAAAEQQPEDVLDEALTAVVEELLR